MTLTLKVYFYTTDAGVRIKAAEAQVSGTDYADVISQCNSAAQAAGWLYTFTEVS